MLRTLLLSALAAGALFAQGGSMERIKVHGKSLEGNLEGDSPDRDVSIYLPPSYKTATSRRYPVIYMLHGFTDSEELWFGWKPHWINLHAVIDKTQAGGGAKEMIVVMPNAYTKYAGSMYSTSVTTGDWETYVTPPRHAAPHSSEANRRRQHRGRFGGWALARAEL